MVTYFRSATLARHLTPVRWLLLGVTNGNNDAAVGVDVVLLATPPGFRPQHIKAAVDAGKHVFAEKPMATDAPGVQSVMQSIEKARKQGTSIVDGFVWRWTYAQRDTYEKILGGDLGDLQAIYSSYNNNARKRYVDWNRENTKTDVEYMLRRWYYFTWLSGDHIVERARD